MPEWCHLFLDLINLDHIFLGIEFKRICSSKYQSIFFYESQPSQIEPRHRPHPNSRKTKTLECTPAPLYFGWLSQTSLQLSYRETLLISDGSSKLFDIEWARTINIPRISREKYKYNLNPCRICPKSLKFIYFYTKWLTLVLVQFMLQACMVLEYGCPILVNLREKYNL